jgi:hypothetical protein
MKSRRSSNQRFPEKPYYKDAEIEAISEEALRSVSLMPESPSPVRIDRFIEKRFGVSHTYEDLPEGVLGFTCFGPKGVQAVCISRWLDDGGKVADRRVRSTLAHEGGHGLLHAHLFLLPTTEPLFGDCSDPAKPKVLCRDDSVAGTPRQEYDGRWWEFQANGAMSCLLLPKPLVLKAMEPYLLTRGLLEVRSVDPARRMDAARALSEIFDVNPVFVKLRIERLFPEAQDSQLAL